MKIIKIFRRTPVEKFLYSSRTTNEQRVKFAILCAMEVYDNLRWRQWAEKWLSGEDRTSRSAWEAGRASTPTHWLVGYFASQAAYYNSGNSDEVLYYAESAAAWAASVRRHEVEVYANKWSPENWEEVTEEWLKDRQIDFKKLIKQAKKTTPLPRFRAKSRSKRIGR